jgi:hypothetical protein
VRKQDLSQRNVRPPKTLAGDEGDRATIRPPFDMEAFARKATGSHAGPSAPEKITERPPPLPPSLPRPPRVPSPPSPNSIEGALLGVIEGAAPIVTGRAIDDPIAEMRQLFSSAQYAGALELADLILTDDPGNEDAIECRQKCQVLLDDGFT